MISRRSLIGGIATSGLFTGCAAPQAMFSTLAGQLSIPVSPTLAPDTLLTRIGVGSCFNQNRPGTLLSTAIRTKPQLFLFMGDNVYGDTRSPDLDELVSAYAAALARPDYRAFRASMPIASTWDDHDFGFNDAGASYAYKDQTRPLFFDFWNVPTDSPRRQTGGIFPSSPARSAPACRPFYSTLAASAMTGG